MGYTNYNNNNNNNNKNNNSNNDQNINYYNNNDTISINDEFRSIPLNNFDDIFQIKLNNAKSEKENTTIPNKYSIIIFKDLHTNQFNDSLPLLLTTIIDNPIQYSNLIDTINHLKLKSSSKLSDSIHRIIFILVFLIIFFITFIILLLLPFNINYYLWLIVVIPIIFISSYIEQFIKIKSIKKFMIETENTHFTLSNMNEWRTQNISFKSIFFRRDEKGFLKKVDSSSSLNDIKEYRNFYQGLIVEFPKNQLNQITIFNLQIMDYKKILNNINNQNYENFDELKKHIKQQQQQQQQSDQNETIIDETDINYNQHFIQNYYNTLGLNKNTTITNSNNATTTDINSNNNNNNCYISYHIPNFTI
ncbi:hypothetical protein DICPUDRAFT_76157 [Dictyostelium purpureum]|uniref:Uncharacterized protein n=1 Tax=Dictyostelium purpureum TaxID=5786 RepID=F0ZCS3_DICPU|nr:uncharacterized protein DICPUDRAFT_76157 [Dictyostelium purpureum]EGC38249.1 hypothetical protein DICPUDRAFT_76157 [Dictyostelium purpureum]|eukprot:XP_003285206.1 hypothetical protein DICPUDRAFT_76157 [Dictyostelium purpureum]